jgi:hypothetical protein
MERCLANELRHFRGLGGAEQNNEYISCRKHIFQARMLERIRSSKIFYKNLRSVMNDRVVHSRKVKDLDIAMLMEYSVLVDCVFYKSYIAQVYL